MRRLFIGIVLCAPLLLAGCTMGRTTFEGTVLRNFGATAVVVPGNHGAPNPRARRQNNAYNYPPGTLLRRVSRSASDGFEASRLQPGVRFCRQLSIYLPATIETKYRDIEEISDFSFSVFGHDAAVREYVDDLGFSDLPDGTIAWINYVRLSLKNVASYELSDEQQANLWIGGRWERRCGIRKKDPYTHIVKRIYVADIETQVVLKEGANLSALRAQAKLVSAASSKFRGKRVVFAMTIERNEDALLTISGR